MKLLTLLFSFLIVQIGIAQTISEKTFPAKNIKELQVQGNAIYKITVETKAVNEVNIITTFEGENSENYMLVTNVSNNTLFVNLQTQPVYTAANDKLSAHKVVAIEVKIIIPEKLNLQVVSDIGSLELSGVYKQVNIALDSGNCELLPFKGSATVKTKTGNIIIKTNYAVVTSNTKYGKTQKQQITTGKNTIKLNSINGNIIILKSE